MANQPFASTIEKQEGAKTESEKNANSETSGTPHEFVSNLSSQRSPEILFNLGLSFFKDHKWEQAFRVFEKSSHLLKNNPTLWYYMGVSVLNLNKEL
jgi:hypothetical protein